MMKLIQISLLIVAVQWFGVYGKPLFQGVSFQRGFEINFKPLPRKPISFIMEKWSPLGVFGRKHAIQRRSSDSEVVPVKPAVPIVVQRPAAPVFEHVEEQEHMDTSALKVLPPQTPRTLLPVPISPPIPPPLSSPAPPPSNVIITPAPKYLSDVPFIPNTGELLPASPLPSDLPLPSPVPAKAGSLPSNIILPPMKAVNSDVPPSGLFTDISRVEAMKEYLDSVQSSPSLTDPVEKVAPQLESNSIQTESPRNNIALNENSLIRGSKMALYYGSVFLQLMSQFLTNARATFDQMTNPPPVYNN